MNTWWLKKNTFKREVLLLFVLMFVIGGSTYRLFSTTIPAALSLNHGLIGLVDGTINSVFGTTGSPSIVIGVGVIIGLVVLISLDHYKYMYGYLLIGATVLGFLVLVQDPRVEAPTDWAWMTNLPYLVFGAGLGLLFGGLRWDGWLPSRQSLTHDYLAHLNSPGGEMEFDRALPRLIYLLGGFLLYLLAEYIVEYRLSPLEITNFRTSGIGLDVVVVGCLLLVLFTVRNYSANRNVILVGATGSGKTTTMAGLSATAGKYTRSKADGPLRTLGKALKERGFEGIDSTSANENIPLGLSFKHGLLFPKRIDLKTIDYAGELVEDAGTGSDFQINVPMPHESDPTVTRNFNQAFDVARRLRSKLDESSDVTFIDEAGPVGKDPEDDEFDWPSEIRTDGDELNDSLVMKQLVQDMIYHADGVGLVMPMDDFGRYAVAGRDFDPPDWVNITPDGEIESPRPRGRYLPLFDKIYNRLGNGRYKHDGKDYRGVGKDVFYLFTFADIAIPAFRAEIENVAQPATDRPVAFTEYILSNFIPAYPDDLGQLGGLYDQRSAGGEPEYLRSNACAVNFEVDENPSDSSGSDTPEGDESPVELADKDNPELHGTRELLDRLGQKWW